MVKNENKESLVGKEKSPTTPMLFIMRGLHFSGKSFLSKEIASHLRVDLLSYDELWKEIKENTGKDLGWEELSQIAERRIAKSLKNGQSIACDTLNDTVGNRQKLRDLASKQSADALVIYTNTPIEIIKMRQHLNFQTGQRHHVSENRFKDAINRFEAPSVGEETIEFKPGSDLDLWFKNLEVRIQEKKTEI